MTSFFNSYLGMFMTQAFCHSIIAFIIVDRAMQVWHVNDPLVRQRFHIIVILLPLFTFPFYQAITPDRGSLSFRMGALFDFNRWLNLEIFGFLPLWIFFIFIIIITAIIFLFQELLPVLKNTLESRKKDEEEKNEYEENLMVNEAIKDLPVEKPDIFVLDDDDNILFSTTGRNASVFISTAFIKILNK